MYKAYSDTELCLQYMMKPASNLAHEDDLLKNHKRLISNGGNPKKTKKLRSVQYYKKRNEDISSFRQSILQELVSKIKFDCPLIL